MKFQPGQSGNPAGRPKGSRHRLQESFLKAFADDFQEHGADTIARVRKLEPSDYLKAAVALVPKQTEKVANPFDDVTDDELDELEAHLAALRAPDGDPTGEGSPAPGEPPAAVPPVPEAG